MNSIISILMFCITLRIRVACVFHIGYEFDDGLGFLPTNSKDSHVLTSDSYPTTMEHSLAKIRISLVGNGITLL